MRFNLNDELVAPVVASLPNYLETNRVAPELFPAECSQVHSDLLIVEIPRIDFVV